MHSIDARLAAAVGLSLTLHAAAGLVTESPMSPQRAVPLRVRLALPEPVVPVLAAESVGHDSVRAPRSAIRGSPDRRRGSIAARQADPGGNPAVSNASEPNLADRPADGGVAANPAPEWAGVSPPHSTAAARGDPLALSHPAEPIRLEPPGFDAAYLQNHKPEYPASARRRGREGTVLLEVRVATSGQPVAVRVARSAGFDELDQAAAEAVRAWRFTPARRGDQPVEASVQVPIRFRIRADP